MHACNHSDLMFRIIDQRALFEAILPQLAEARRVAAPVAACSRWEGQVRLITELGAIKLQVMHATLANYYGV